MQMIMNTSDHYVFTGGICKELTHDFSKKCPIIFSAEALFRKKNLISQA